MTSNVRYNRKTTDQILVTHVNSLSMVIYGLILSVLLDEIQGNDPGFIQSWYDDDFIKVDDVPHIKHTITIIQVLGPTHVLFIKLKKSYFDRGPLISK